ILYGFAFNVSIGDLFLADVLPGLMLAAMFCVYVMIRHRAGGSDGDIATGSKLRALASLLPLLLLIAIVFVAIYGGFATPTEAAVIGVAGALFLGYMDGELSFSIIVESLKASVM